MGRAGSIQKDDATVRGEARNVKAIRRKYSRLVRRERHQRVGSLIMSGLRPSGEDPGGTGVTDPSAIKCAKHILRNSGAVPPAPTFTRPPAPRIEASARDVLWTPKNHISEKIPSAGTPIEQKSLRSGINSKGRDSHRPSRPQVPTRARVDQETPAGPRCSRHVRPAACSGAANPAHGERRMRRARRRVHPCGCRWWRSGQCGCACLTAPCAWAWEWPREGRRPGWSWS